MLPLFTLLMALFGTLQAGPLTELKQNLRHLSQQDLLDGTALVARGSRKLLYLDTQQSLHSQYVLGSVGKQMSAAALLKALYDRAPGTEDEKIATVKRDLQKPLIEFIAPDAAVWQKNVPEWAHKVTLHQLLCHQSGLPDYTHFERFFEKDAQGLGFEEVPHETWEFLDIIAGKPLDFAPGTAEAYSNTGYTLIKEVISQVTKMPAGEYLNQYLFKPLGMTNTCAPQEGNWQSLHQQASTSQLLPPLSYDQRAIYPAKQLPDVAGSGPLQLISSSHDLLKWNIALHKEHKVLPEALYELMVAPHSKGPTGYGYGYGISREMTRFGIAYSHSAGGARLIYVPSIELSLIALSNVSLDLSVNELPDERGFEAISSYFTRFLSQ